MFLRSHERRKDGKRHVYWSVVENRRVSSGRVVQRQATSHPDPGGSGGIGVLGASFWVRGSGCEVRTRPWSWTWVMTVSTGALSDGFSAGTRLAG